MPEQFIIDTNAVLAWCGLIAAIGVALGWMAKALKPMMKPFKAMQHELDEIEKRGHDHDERFQRGENRMEKHDKMLAQIQADNKVIMESIALLMRHAETGNNTGEVAQGRANLEKHLINR